MDTLLGIILHFGGGFAAGSYYLPFTKLRGKAWEDAWIFYGFCTWVILPIVATMLTVPSLIDIFQRIPISLIIKVLASGMIWGVGALNFGLALRYLGMALGTVLALGVCVITTNFLFPSILEHQMTGFCRLFENTTALIRLVGIILAMLGLSVYGYMGVNKAWAFKARTSYFPTPEFSLKKGLISALIFGFFMPFMLVGVELSKPISDMALLAHSNKFFAHNIGFMLLCMGGFMTNFCWYLVKNRKSIKKIVPIAIDSRYVITYGLAGLCGYLQFFFYGMGEVYLQHLYQSWMLNLIFIMLTVNFWSYLLGEWVSISQSIFSWYVIGLLITLTAVVILSTVLMI